LQGEKATELEFAMVADGWFPNFLIPVYELPKGEHEFPCHFAF
jgi:hypothetical protein